MSWHDRRRKWQERAASFLEIPREVALDLPKIVMVGDVQIFIENHKGIIEYSPEKVRIRTSLGELAVLGENLFLRHIVMEEIILEGKINGVLYGEGTD